MLSLLCDMQNERVLFHYNGHGVPRPTVNGEIWVFNKSYTQYIPMSIYDLQSWLGTPCIFVFDCSAAGLIVNSFKAFAEQKTQVGLLSPPNRFASPSVHAIHQSFCSSFVHSYIHPFSHSARHLFIHSLVHLSHVTCLPKGQASVPISLLRLCALAEDVSDHALDGIHKPALKQSYRQRSRVLQMHALHAVQILETPSGDAHALLQPRESWTTLARSSASLSKQLHHVKVAPATSPALV